jgi:hypothetical protein
MAALDEINVEELEPSTTSDIAKEAIAKLFWHWYHMNLDRSVTTIKVWFFRKTVTVKDLKGIFELLFGPVRYV